MKRKEEVTYSKSVGMFDDDFEGILQWHPELMLVSRNPFTWEGFLNASRTSTPGQNTRIKLKLTVPNYPSLSDAQINFGKAITSFRNQEFRSKVFDLMQTSSKVSRFLRQLQSLINVFIDNTSIEEVSCSLTENSAMEVLKELQDAFRTPNDVRLLSNSTLDIIKLSLNDVSLKLQRAKNGANPWMVVQSDLPEIELFGPFDRNISSLRIARNKFKLQVEMLEKSWSRLRQIDENCWVIDPLEPKPCHLYRRIHVTPTLTMFINIDPLNPADLPEIKFSGTDKEIEAQKNIMSTNIHMWNPEQNILDNLLALLGVDAFPKKAEAEENKDEDVFYFEDECCICFLVKLDNEHMPDKVCSNQKCRRHFHTACLLQWLQAVAGNRVVFNYIYGACPECGESISCYIGE